MSIRQTNFVLEKGIGHFGGWSVLVK